MATKPTPSWRDVLKIHPAAELFPRMSPAELRALGEDIKKNGLHSLVTVWKEQKHITPKLLDGRNRLDAMEAVGFTITVENVGTDADPAIRLWERQSPKQIGMRIEIVEVRGDRPGGDPYSYVISANIHRRHLTAEQKRDLIAKLIKATPGKSDRQIAETVKASHHTVGSVRTKMESRGQVAHVSTRTDTKGRKQPTKRPTKEAKAKVPKHDSRIIAPKLAYRVGRFAHDLILSERLLARELADIIMLPGVRERLSADLTNGLALMGNDADPEISADSSERTP